MNLKENINFKFEKITNLIFNELKNQKLEIDLLIDDYKFDKLEKINKTLNKSDEFYKSLDFE